MAQSGRQRAKQDPFWATAKHNMRPNAVKLVEGLQRLIDRHPFLKRYVWIGSGWRTGSQEHSSGRAVDVMFVANTGRRPTADERRARNIMTKFYIDNGKEIGLQWVLVSRDGKARTESYNFDRGTWRALGNRGSVSANHVDHHHLYLKPNGKGWTNRLDNHTIPGLETGTVKPTTPSGNAAQRGDHTPLLYNANNHPRGSSHGNRVKKLQAGLNRVFPAYRHSIQPKGRLLAADGWFGAHTERWVREFQRRVGVKVDGIVGRDTLSALARHGVRL